MKRISSIIVWTTAFKPYLIELRRPSPEPDRGDLSADAGTGAKLETAVSRNGPYKRSLDATMSPGVRFSHSTPPEYGAIADARWHHFSQD